MNPLQVTVSICLIMTSVLLGFQVDRWAEDRRKQTQETVYLERMKQDLVTDAANLQRRVEYFSDIQGFTELTDRVESEVLTSALNKYLNEMSKIALDHGGTIDKVVGDAIHAIFGAPQPQPDHARRAVQCALDMDAFATEFMKKKQAEGIALGPTRIGVNSGAAMVGNFGGETLFDYTAHGEAINIAARLETANKVLGTRICVSGETVSRIRDFHGRPVGALMLRGKTDAVEVFEPLPADDGSALDAYSGAYQCLAAGEPGAVAAFEALAETAPDDPLVVLHLGRLRAGETGTTLDLR